MPDELMTTFEKLWVALRAAWCDNHDLNGALAFSHDRAAMDFLSSHCAGERGRCPSRQVD